MIEIEAIEDWDAQFHPIDNHLDEHASFGGTMFETYGAELEYVRNQPVTKVWTYVDGDHGAYIVNGYYFVNRIGYFVTEVPWVDDVTVTVFEEDDEEGFPCQECGAEMLENEWYDSYGICDECKEEEE